MLEYDKLLVGAGFELEEPATKEEINRLEDHINMKLPEDLKSFYRIMNGTKVRKDWSMFYNIDSVIECHYCETYESDPELFPPDSIKEKFIPIFSDQSMDNYVLMLEGNGAIAYHPHDNWYDLVPEFLDFDSFLKKLVLNPDRFSDGRKIDFPVEKNIEYSKIIDEKQDLLLKVDNVYDYQFNLAFICNFCPQEDIKKIKNLLRNREKYVDLVLKNLESRDFDLELAISILESRLGLVK
jgi:hypothetical protein